MLALAVLSGLALAQQGQQQGSGPEPNIQRFLPTGATQGFATVVSARQLPAEGFGFDAFVNYAYRPFQRSVIVDGRLERDEGAVDGLFATHLRFAYGVTDFFEPSIQAPVLQVSQSGEAIGQFGGQDIGAGIGDIELVGAFRALSEEDPLGVVIAPFFTIPSGSSGAFLSHGVPTVGSRVAFSKTAEPIHISATGGYRMLPQGSTIDGIVAVDDEVMYGGGIGFEITEQFRLNLEAQGLTIVGPSKSVLELDLAGAMHSPFETYADLVVLTESGMRVMLGGGPGLTPAVGTPAWRLFGSIAYAPPKIRDKDGDGYMDPVDACPEEPEDFDQYQDEDGCPELDNDLDRILDTNDSCPLQPEDYDNFQDTDGCPDPDNDQDRIPDVVDSCPMQPEDYNGLQDTDGCPDGADRDGDGIPDILDRCPDHPEDYDNWEDPDGCPDPDNDFDGLLDPVDQCPNVAETFNNFQDEDGCPDNPLVQIRKDQIVIMEKVLFYTAEARIVEDSYPLLEAVLQILIDHPELTLVRIEGHTDSRGSESYNQKLSEKRAQAIRTFLVDRGVATERLLAEGKGEMVPLATNDTSEGREQNRRVEFHIVR